MGVALVFQSTAYLINWREGTLFSCFIGLLLLVSGAALLIGYLTPFASALSAAIVFASSFYWIPSPHPDLFESKLAAAFVVVISIAIVCLGPGGFSVDARRFGRREIIIPDASHPPER